MELESVMARVAQLEKDLAECRAKVFFLEAINEQRIFTPREEAGTSKWDATPIVHPGSEGNAGGPDPTATRKLSPWTYKLRPKTYDEEATEEVLAEKENTNPYLDKLVEEMFDGNS